MEIVPYDRTAAELARDLEDMHNPIIWPMWPYLPLKRKVRKDGSILVEAAFLYASNPPLLVYGNVFAEDRQAMPREALTPEQVQAAGWVVD